MHDTCPLQPGVAKVNNYKEVCFIEYCKNLDVLCKRMGDSQSHY